jgi:hypothetical protein
MNPETEIFCLCEYAEVVGGKLNIRGSYLQIRVPSFPIRIEMIFIPIRIRFDREDDGQHVINLRGFDSTGKAIGPPMELPCTVTLANKNDPYAWTLMVAIARNVILKAADVYRWELSIDGQNIANSLLCVIGP